MPLGGALIGAVPILGFIRYDTHNTQKRLCGLSPFHSKQANSTNSGPLLTPYVHITIKTCMLQFAHYLYCQCTFDPCCEYGHIYTRAYIQMQVASLCRGRVHISIWNEVNCRIWGKKDETGSASYEILYSMEWLLP